MILIFSAIIFLLFSLATSFVFFRLMKKRMEEKVVSEPVNNEQVPEPEEQEAKNIWVPVGMSLLGRLIDADGKPCDDGPEILPEEYYPLEVAPPEASTRLPINRRFQTGVRAIDSMLTIGKGQRMGIFSGAGTGKSALLGMIARNNNADINVICLIGERPREVLDFIKRNLGEKALMRSVIVAADTDQPAASRIRAAYVCTSIAEFFRDKGKDVALLVESITRFTHAQRDCSLAKGEPLAVNGYPLCVFEMIPNLIFRSGTNDKGTITAFYSALSDGVDLNNPILEKVKGCLDGHIVLSRKLVWAGHYPAIDILASLSRLSKMVTGKQTQKAVNFVRTLMKNYADTESLINAGTYQKGLSPSLDLAIEKHSEIEEFLKQEEDECSSMTDSLNMLSQLTGINIPSDE